jgi:SAM-dependent methyltransferase
MPVKDAHLDWRTLNRKNWDERVPVHFGPGGYDLSSQRAGRGRLDTIVEAELSSVAGLRVLHLQCHLGDDSIALSQRGAAEVVGVDFSAPAIEAATSLAAECGVTNTRFVLSDVLEAPTALPGEVGSFDLVFTTWGTVTWYPDVARWGQVVGHFLRPGGALYFADMHPAAAVFDGLADQADADARPGWLVPYFGRAPQVFDDPTDYANAEARLANSRTVNWSHPLADILGSLRAAGLALDWLHEHPRLTWKLFPGLVQDADQLWTWPGRPWLPLAVSLRAVRL